MTENHPHNQHDRQNKAVALKYRHRSDNAPKVIAKGRGVMADKIIEIAKAHHIHVHEDPDMIEVLSQLDLNEEIPADLYAVIAELLSFVYGLNREKTSR